jgi:hypothetical protein
MCDYPRPISGSRRVAERTKSVTVKKLKHAVSSLKAIPFSSRPEQTLNASEISLVKSRDVSLQAQCIAMVFRALAASSGSLGIKRETHWMSAVL